MNEHGLAFGERSLAEWVVALDRMAKGRMQERGEERRERLSEVGSRGTLPTPPASFHEFRLISLDHHDLNQHVSLG
jgi:hypothetical protein